MGEVWEGEKERKKGKGKEREMGMATFFFWATTTFLIFGGKEKNGAADRLLST